MVNTKSRRDKMKETGIECAGCGKHIKPQMRCSECGRWFPLFTKKHWMVAGAVCAVMGYFNFTEYMAVAAAEFGGTYQWGIYWGKPEYLEMARLQGAILFVAGVVVFIRGYLKTS
jgi:hypothetical protein